MYRSHFAMSFTELGIADHFYEIAAGKEEGKKVKSIISDKIVTARKAHRCDACRTWIDSNYSEADCTDKQRMAVAEAEADNWRILPGQKYLKMVYVECGDLMTYRARPDMDAVCNELDLFD